MLGWIGKLFSSPARAEHDAATAASPPDASRRQAEACKDRGNAHLANGELDAALACYRQAVDIDPGYAEGHNNLGAALLQQGRNDEAIACCRRALALKPDLVQPHVNLGNAYKNQGRKDQAIACFHAALSRNADLPEVHNNLGLLLLERGRLDDALVCFGKALALAPDLAPAHNNMGMAAADQGRLDDAYVHYQKALVLRPDYAEAMSNFLLTTQYDASYSPLAIYEEHLRFGERFETPRRNAWPRHDNDRAPGRRLKIGFVSGDFRAHPVGYFMENVLAHLDPRALDVSLYPTSPEADELTRRLRDGGVCWRPLHGLSDDDAARRIGADGIDILVDLSGHTADNRLLVFARKPAPIQVSWLYFSTTGLQSMDYLLCDRHVMPPTAEAFLTEAPWRLPDSYLCFTPPREDVAIGELPARQNGHVTFGCFNNLTKANEAVVRCWAQILRTVADSRLFLKSRQLNDAATRSAVVGRFGAQGIDAGRLILEGSSPRVDYLASYNRVDIALDPFPFPGGTTTVEALWMGVPVLSRAGDRFISRAGESILRTAGLPDWIARDDADYVAKAASFAAAAENLAQLRSTLRPRFLASPLCDAPRFARNLEAAFRGMWKAYVEGDRAPPA
ncbi:MAG: tetratricopeptide repeat protein [Rhodocyclaceae bacterium]|nr:tetratricopeptide repeat protein [Rhodocyclaceae bacterium]